MNKNRTQTAELRRNLICKLQQLQQREESLEKELSSLPTFCMEKYRELQVVRNGIECTQNRIDGKFTDDRSEFEKKLAT